MNTRAAAEAADAGAHGEQSDMDQLASIKRQLWSRGYREKDGGRTLLEIAALGVRGGSPHFQVRFYYPDEIIATIQGPYAEVLAKVAQLPLR